MAVIFLAVGVGLIVLFGVGVASNGLADTVFGLIVCAVLLFLVGACAHAEHQVLDHILGSLRKLGASLPSRQRAVRSRSDKPAGCSFAVCFFYTPFIAPLERRLANQVTKSFCPEMTKETKGYSP